MSKRKHHNRPATADEVRTAMLATFPELWDPVAHQHFWLKGSSAPDPLMGAEWAMFCLHMAAWQELRVWAEHHAIALARFDEGGDLYSAWSGNRRYLT